MQPLFDSLLYLAVNLLGWSDLIQDTFSACKPGVKPGVGNSECITVWLYREPETSGKILERGGDPCGQPLSWEGYPVSESPEDIMNANHCTKPTEKPQYMTWKSGNRFGSYFLLNDQTLWLSPPRNANWNTRGFYTLRPFVIAPLKGWEGASCTLSWLLWLGVWVANAGALKWKLGHSIRGKHSTEMKKQRNK